MLSDEPIFIHAWWRSGSTYIWLKLREIESNRCYYEPLHEEIAGLDADAIAGPPVSDLARALRHPVAKKNYYAEYLDLLRSSRLRYSPELAYDRYLLRPDQADNKLRSYLKGLLADANLAARRPVLGFCRSQMRSAWMKETFGGIHLAQIRNPADQWASFKINPYFPITMIMIALKLRNLHPRAFLHIEPFERFAQQLSRRPALPVEVISGQFIRQRDCFDVFLVVWIASAMQAIAYCDFVLDIDLMASNLDSRSTTAKWLESIGCSVDFSDCLLPTSTTLNVRSPLFEQTVKAAASAIRSDAASLLIVQPKALEQKLSSVCPLSQWVLRLALGYS
jgi:hypothetical protein